MTKQYVEFFYPGSFFVETSVKEIQNRSGKIKLPKGSYGYRFFDVEEYESPTGEILRGKRKNINGTFYKGRVYSLEEVEKELPEEKELIRKMKSRKCKFIVRTTNGMFFEFSKNDGDQMIEGN